MYAGALTKDCCSDIFALNTSLKMATHKIRFRGFAELLASSDCGLAKLLYLLLK